MRFYESELITGKPVSASGRTIIPQAKRTIIRMPGRNRALVIGRPTAVLVEEPGREEYLVPIRDETDRARRTVFIQLALTLLAGGLLGRKRRVRRDRAAQGAIR